MTTLRKIGLTTLATFAIVGCSQTESLGSAKSYLLGQGFTETHITVMSGEDYKKTQSDTFVADGLKEYLAGTKPAASEKEKPQEFYCWYFETFDQADKFVKDYVGDIYHSLQDRCEDPRMGSRNNAAWAGTNSIAVGLGWVSA